MTTATLKVFALGDYEIWAGESLEECIHAAVVMAFTHDTPETREESGYVGNSFELSDKQVVDIEDEGLMSWRTWIETLTARGQEFPCIIGGDF